MKKRMILLAVTAALLLLTAACGGDTGNTDSPDTSDVALNSFYAGLEQEYGWTEDAANSGPDDLLMTNIEGDMLESYYPGLSELTTKQLVAKMPMMSSLVNELVFLQCETEEDAAKAAEILQARISYQVGDENNPGGAWYPESIAAWEKAQVIQEGTYVALVASAEHQADIVERFQQQFQ